MLDHLILFLGSWLLILERCHLFFDGFDLSIILCLLLFHLSLKLTFFILSWGRLSWYWLSWYLLFGLFLVCGVTNNVLGVSRIVCWFGSILVWLFCLVGFGFRGFRMGLLDLERVNTGLRGLL